MIITDTHEPTATVPAPSFRRTVKAWTVVHHDRDNDNYPRSRDLGYRYLTEAAAIAAAAEHNAPALAEKLAEVRRHNAAVTAARIEHEVLVAAGVRPADAPGAHRADLLSEEVELHYWDSLGVYEVEKSYTDARVVWADLPEAEKDAIIAAMGRG